MTLSSALAACLEDLHTQYPQDLPRRELPVSSCLLPSSTSLQPEAASRSQFIFEFPATSIPGPTTVSAYSQE